MILLKLLLSSLLTSYCVNCSHLDCEDLPNTVSGIKEHSELEIQYWNLTVFPCMDYITTHNPNCKETMDIRSCCYFSTYLASLPFKYVELEDLHWTRIDLRCLLGYLTKNNNCYKLKKSFLET